MTKNRTGAKQSPSVVASSPSSPAASTSRAGTGTFGAPRTSSRVSKRRLAVLFTILGTVAAIGLAYRVLPALNPDRDLKNASLSTLVSLTRQHPKSARAFYNLALKFQDIGYPRSAYNTLQHASQLDPDDPQICIATAAASRPLDDGRAAVLNLSKFSTRHPDNVDVKYALAGILWQSRNYELARGYLLDILKRQPDNAEAWYRYGATLNFPDREADEAEAYERAVGLEPGNVMYRLDLAGIQAHMGRLKESEANYRTTLAQAPDDPTVCATVGRFLTQHGAAAAKKSEGERLLVKALQIDPANVEAHYDLGVAQEERGAYKEAIENLEFVVAKQPDSPEGLFALARAYQRHGDDAKAEKTLATAQKIRTTIVSLNEIGSRIREKPGDPQLRIKMARLYIQKGQPADAVEQYNAAIKLDPKNIAFQAEATAFTAHWWPVKVNRC